MPSLTKWNVVPPGRTHGSRTSDVSTNTGIVPAPMNGEPGGLAYVLGPDGRYHSVCLTVLSLDAEGRVVELTTFVLPELFAAWGFPPVLDA